MIKIKIDGKTIGTLDEFKTAEKPKSQIIDVNSDGATTTFTNLKTDRGDMSKWLEQAEYKPTQVEFFEDKDGRIWALKNAYIKSIDYSFEDNGVKIDEVDFVAEELEINDK